MNILAAYLHDIDPYAVRLWEGGPVRWYGLSYIGGFLLGYIIIRALTRRARFELQPSDVADLVIHVAIGIVVGGRLGYAVFYQRSLFWGFTPGLPFWDLLALNKGGMASHGGFVGLVVAALWYARRRRVNGLSAMDLAVFAGSIGLFFGRVANFVNGELYGRPCAPDFALAVRFPQEMLHWGQAQLAPIGASLRGMMPADAAARDVVEWSIAAIQRGNRAVADLVEPLLTPRHPSQLYEAVLEGVLLFAVLGLTWARPRKPGVIFGLCCVVYAIVRVVGEQFREPDAHIGYTVLAGIALTRGQLLSIAMLAIGVVMLALCQRRPVARVGGWAGKRRSDEGA